MQDTAVSPCESRRQGHIQDLPPELLNAILSQPEVQHSVIDLGNVDPGI